MQLFYDLEDYERITGRPFPSSPHLFNPQREPQPEQPGRHPIKNNVKAVVWAKTEGLCYHCRRVLNPFREFHIDHLVPLSKGGSDNVENLVPSCATCNLKKGTRPC